MVMVVGGSVRRLKTSLTPDVRMLKASLRFVVGRFPTTRFP